MNSYQQIPSKLSTEQLPDAQFRSNYPLIRDVHQTLSPDDALEILKTSKYYNAVEDFIAAEGGQVFLFKPENLLNKDDWTKGGHLMKMVGFRLHDLYFLKLIVRVLYYFIISIKN